MTSLGQTEGGNVINPRMLGRIGRLVVYLLAAVVCFGQAHAASPGAAAKISRLMEASGINYSLRQLPLSMVAGFDTGQREPLPANVRAALREAVLQGFQPAPMLENVHGKLAGTLTEKQIDDSLAWLEAPLGRRITTLENAASEPAAVPKMQAYVETLQKQPVSPARTRLIEVLDRAIGAQEAMLNFAEATVLATALGINAAQPRQQQVAPDLLQKEVKAGMPEMRKQLGQMVTGVLLYTYRSLSDKDIEAYIQFAKSASGAAYHKSAVASVNDAMVDGSHDS